jgi:glycosyltransferase involved in cell wall biosynthesis
MSDTGDYVLITPARNEAGHLPRTIAAVAAQLRLPREWVIVDDGSTDATARIAEEAALRHPFVRCLRVEREGGRCFGQKARAFAVGRAHLRSDTYAFIGNLDADIELPPDYYAQVLERMARDPRIGLAGGCVQTRVGETFHCSDRSPDTVAGAVQLFRRACFEEIGGYPALPFGGIDAAAELAAKQHGWRVEKLLDLTVSEHRRTGGAEAHPLRAKFNEGRRFHSLGYGTGWFLLRCLYRAGDPPLVAGSVAAAAGYLESVVRGRPVVLPPATVAYWRSEHRRRIRNAT